jgi:hypothetical protein
MTVEIESAESPLLWKQYSAQNELTRESQCDHYCVEGHVPAWDIVSKNISHAQHHGLRSSSTYFGEHDLAKDSMASPRRERTTTAASTW